MPHGETGLGSILTETSNAASASLDQLSALEMVRLMHAADIEAVRAVEAQEHAIAEAIETIAQRLRAGGRLIYVGAGTSGRLGVLDASECPPTFNCPPSMVQGLIAGGDRALRHAVEGAEDNAEQAGEDLDSLAFCAADTLVGIAASGRTPYVLGGLSFARRLGAWTIGLSCIPASPVSRLCDLAITPVTGPEVVTGSTRLKAGTATKLVLNMLSTGVMAKLGYVYGNLMVNVQASNAKLKDRATRIVAQITGLPAEQASALLGSAQSVQGAVVMHYLGVSSADAEAKLLAAGRRLRDVIG